MYKYKSIFKMNKLVTLSQCCSMSSSSSSSSSKIVRPMMSSDLREARLRALGLYRAIYRNIPYMLRYYDIPKNTDNCRWMLRSYFYKHACLTDVRVIDVLIIKGYIELKEMTHHWQLKHHVIRHWNPSIEPKCTTFMAKFLQGN